MLKKALLSAVALFALVGHAQAEDLKEFRVGIIGGENEADRLRNYQCLVDQLRQPSASRRSPSSRRPTMTA